MKNNTGNICAWCNEMAVDTIDFESDELELCDSCLYEAAQEIAIEENISVDSVYESYVHSNLFFGGAA